jgi:hypothetical protein
MTMDRGSQVTFAAPTSRHSHGVHVPVFEGAWGFNSPLRNKTPQVQIERLDQHSRRIVILNNYLVTVTIEA